MPVGTIDPNKYERFELKTLKADPNVVGDEDGYVMLRPLPFGLKLERRDKATKMSMEAATGKGRKGEDTQKFELETLSKWSRAYDFKHCVGEHNITDVNGVLLDFGNPMTLQLLAPKVGSELEALIDALNEDESEESLEDFIERSTSQSQNTATESTTES
jgi:hypothetical protein